MNIDQQIADAQGRIAGRLTALGEIAHKEISRMVHFKARSEGQKNRWKKVKSQGEA